MITHRGRVVYERKKNFFKPKDIARILDTYSERTTGNLFGEFLWNVVQLTLDRRRRESKFIQDFWGTFWDHLVAVAEYWPARPIEGVFEELVEEVGGLLAGPPDIIDVPETGAEKKRRLIRERK